MKTPPDTVSPRDEQISAYLDGELDQAAREAFEREMAQDPELAAEVHELQDTLQALQGLHLPMPSEDFLQDVERKINRRSRGRFFETPEPRMRVPYEIFAALMLIILGAVYFYGQANEPFSDRDLAMGSDGPAAPQAPAAPQEAPAQDKGAKEAPDAQVQPLRKEIIQYSLTLRTQEPVQEAAQELAARIRSTNLAYKIDQPPQRRGERSSFQVTLPQEQLKGFLEAFGKQMQLRRTRLYVQGDAPREEVSVQIAVEPSHKEP